MNRRGAGIALIALAVWLVADLLGGAKVYLAFILFVFGMLYLAKGDDEVQHPSQA